MIGSPVASPFQILFVCTGNICRSPLAERLLRARLQAVGPGVADHFAVQSAGVGALVDHPMDDQAAAALAELGGDSRDFRARLVTAGMIRKAGLVLTAEQKHRARVLREQPTALRRTFTLREFAGVCAALDDNARDLPPADVVGLAAAERGSTRVEDYDIPDPFRRSDAEHATAARLISEAIDVIAPVLVSAAGVSR